eukprot:g15556.t1
MDVHGKDEVLETRELEVLEEVEGVGGVTGIGGELLDQRGENGLEISRDKFGGAGAGGDNGSTRAVRFVDFGTEIEAGGAGLGTMKLEAVGG